MAGHPVFRLLFPGFPAFPPSIPHTLPVPLHLLSWCFICVCLFHGGRGEKKEIRQGYIMLTLWKKLPESFGIFSSVPSVVFTFEQSAWNQKGTDACFFHFLWIQTWHVTSTGENRMTSEAWLMFLWVVSYGFVWAFVWLFLSAAHFRVMEIFLTFGRQDSYWLWVTVLCFDYLWGFVDLFQDFCPCGLARRVIVTNRIWLLQTIGARSVNGILCCPGHERRLRK